jgi:hypothetical protein
MQTTPAFAREDVVAARLALRKIDRSLAALVHECARQRWLAQRAIVLLDRSLPNVEQRTEVVPCIAPRRRRGRRRFDRDVVGSR